MTAMVRMGRRLYSASLPLYPAELRREFGAEMVEAFTDDMEDACRHRGFKATARVWGRALSELLRIALPQHLQKPAIAVPCILFACCEIVWSVQMMMIVHRTLPAGLIAVMMFFPSLTVALTAAVAVCAGNRSLPTPLRIGGETCSKSAI
jgi:hypothetical protein